MHIFYLGTPPPEFLSAPWAIAPTPYVDQPVFSVDGLIVFANENLSPRDREACQLLERSGRPVIRVGPVNVPVYRPVIANILMVREYSPTDELAFEAWLRSRPRTNYQLINCSFYDRIEAAIVNREPVELIYRLGNGEATATTRRLLDTKTDQTEEYVQVEGGAWIRLDRIISLDGILTTAGCRF